MNNGSILNQTEVWKGVFVEKMGTLHSDFAIKLVGEVDLTNSDFIF